MIICNSSSCHMLYYACQVRLKREYLDGQTHSQRDGCKVMSNITLWLSIISQKMCTILWIELDAEVAGSKWRRVVWSTGITGCKSGCWTCNPSSLWLWSNYFLWWKVLSYTYYWLSSLKCTLIWPSRGFWLHLLQLFVCEWIIFKIFLCAAGFKL